MHKFWMTTGLFPQELLIDLKGVTTVNEVRIASHSSLSRARTPF